MHRSARGSIQPHIQWVPGTVFPGVKRPGRETDHSPPSSAEVKNSGAKSLLPHTSSWCGACVNTGQLYVYMEKSPFWEAGGLTASLSEPEGLLRVYSRVPHCFLSPSRMTIVHTHTSCFCNYSGVYARILWYVQLTYISKCLPCVLHAPPIASPLVWITMVKFGEVHFTSFSLIIAWFRGRREMPSVWVGTPGGKRPLGRPKP
jgi:hypothetical protein